MICITCQLTNKSYKVHIFYSITLPWKTAFGVVLNHIEYERLWLNNVNTSAPGSSGGTAKLIFFDRVKWMNDFSKATYLAFSFNITFFVVTNDKPLQMSC